MKIFINYRHEDAGNKIFSISNFLSANFGVENVFFSTGRLYHHQKISSKKSKMV